MPIKSKLYDPTLDKQDAAKFEDLEWKRASEIYANPCIFKDGIDPNDVNQGALGDCYFLAALSSLAEFPKRVKKLFVTQTVNRAGVYLVNFYLNGRETPVMIDDYLPVTLDGRPAFASSREGELWVCLLEKAWAKLHGSYARIEGGLPGFAISHLTGVPVQNILHDTVQNNEDFFDLMEASDRKNFVMMAASRESAESDLAGDEGLVTGHAYSVISVHRVQHQGRPLSLLKLRNPWGAGEWTGAWSDKSSTWTPQIKEQVGFSGVANDGIFFIELADYLSHFQWTSICIDGNANKYTHS